MLAHKSESFVPLLHFGTEGVNQLDVPLACCMRGDLVGFVA